MSDSIRTALERLIASLDDYEPIWGGFPESALADARAALAGQPTPPAEGEVVELLAQLEVAAVTVESEGGDHEAAAVRRAAELLQQFASPPCLVLKPSPEALAALKAAGPGRIELLPDDAQIIEPSRGTLLVPVPTPVPVSERLPEPEDCDVEGRCWWFDDDDDKWCFDTPYMGARLLCWTHWLPAHALPLPQGEVEK